MISRVSFLLIRVASLLVPRDRRGEWLEEWRGELAALKQDRADGVSSLPSTIGFAVGSLPHALWMRTEGWTMETMKMTGLWNDARFALRGLFRAPGFTAITIGTLALGIGATTAIFTVVNGVLLKSLPFEDQHELVGVLNRTARSDGFSLSPAQYFTFRD